MGFFGQVPFLSDVGGTTHMSWGRYYKVVIFDSVYGLLRLCQQSSAIQKISFRLIPKYFLTPETENDWSPPIYDVFQDAVILAI